MAMPFPPETYEITTPRLVIRTPILEDAEAYVGLLGKVENLPMGETEAMTDVTVNWVAERTVKWKTRASEGKDAFLSIALRDTNETIGYMAFNCFRSKAEYDGTEPERDTPLPGLEGRYLTDIGVMVDHTRRRKGYTTEVLCAAIEFAFNNVGCQVARLETGLENEPWRALMRSMGFGGIEEKGRASYRDHPMGWLYKVDRDTWQKAKDGLKARGKWPL